MKRLIPIVLLLLIGTLPSLANDTYAIEIKAGEKVLNVSELNLPPTTTLKELLQMFPELLAREGDTQLNNFDLQIDGVTTSTSKEILLEQLFAAEISKIAVSTSPDMGQQKNGQGGVINLKLNPMPEGFSGYVGVEASSMFDVMPQAVFNYRKGKVQMSASLSMEYYQPYDNVERTVRQVSGMESNRYDTIDNKYGSERASFTLKYNPNDRNELKFWVWESYDKDCKDNAITVRQGQMTQKSSEDSRISQLSVNAGAKYKLQFIKGVLEAEAIYAYNPSYTSMTQSAYLGISTSQYDYNMFNQRLSGLVKYKYLAIQDRPGDKCDVIGGVRYNYQPNALEYGMPKELFKGSSNVMHLSPYIEADAVLGKFFAKGGASYLIYWKNMQGEGYDSYKTTSNHVTGYLDLGWQVAPHNHLSLIMKRSINTPSPAQLYPNAVTIAKIGEVYEGNPDLQASTMHNIDLNYIYDHAWAAGSKMTVDASVQYICNRDLINSYTEGGVIKYANNGKSDIATFNLMMLYNSKVFSVNLTGNAFRNWSCIKGVNDKYSYFNVNLTPSLNFNDTWMLSASFMYNSKIYTNTSRLSDYFYSQVRVARCWDDWTLSVSIMDNFHSSAIDEIQTDADVTMKYYNLHRPCLNIGVHKIF